MNLYVRECLSVCQEVSDCAPPWQCYQPITLKIGSKFIPHLFQAISYTSDVIESELLHHMLSLPTGLIMSYYMTNRK